MLLDLVQADDVATMGILLSGYKNLDRPVLRTLLEETISFGSAALLKLLFGCEIYFTFFLACLPSSSDWSQSYSQDSRGIIAWATLAVESNNHETFECIIKQNAERSIMGGRLPEPFFISPLCIRPRIFATVMCSDSSELRKIWETHADKELSKGPSSPLLLKFDDIRR